MLQPVGLVRLRRNRLFIRAWTATCWRRLDRADAGTWWRGLWAGLWSMGCPPIRSRDGVRPRRTAPILPRTTRRVLRIPALRGPRRSRMSARTGISRPKTVITQCHTPFLRTPQRSLPHPELRPTSGLCHRARRRAGSSLRENATTDAGRSGPSESPGQMGRGALSLGCRRSR